jgi:hypothetical protein
MKCPSCNQILQSPPKPIDSLDEEESILNCGNVNHPSFNLKTQKWIQGTPLLPEIFEINKTIEVNKTMTLLDLNGSKTNFQSEFFIKSKDPSKNYLISIVNQDELDEGQIDFEETTNGQIAKKLIYQENIQKNHFLIVKKNKNDVSEAPIICDVIIKLSELPKIEQSMLRPMANTPMQDTPMQDTPMQDMPMQDMPMQDMPMANTQGKPMQADNSFRYMYITIGIICLTICLFFILKKK